VTRLATTNGTEGAAVYLTELEAAIAANEETGAVQHRNTALDEAARFRRHLKTIRLQLGKAIRRRTSVNKNWEPDVEFATTLQKLADAQAKAVATEERLRKINREDRKNYSPEQLESVWRHNHRRSIAAWAADEWRDAFHIGFGPSVADVLMKMLAVKLERPARAEEESE
jgi:hypothetical protein